MSTSGWVWSLALSKYIRWNPQEGCWVSEHGERFGSDPDQPQNADYSGVPSATIQTLNQSVNTVYLGNAGATQPYYGAQSQGTQYGAPQYYGGPPYQRGVYDQPHPGGNTLGPGSPGDFPYGQPSAATHSSAPPNNSGQFYAQPPNVSAQTNAYFNSGGHLQAQASLDDSTCAQPGAGGDGQRDESTPLNAAIRSPETSRGKRTSRRRKTNRRPSEKVVYHLEALAQRPPEEQQAVGNQLATSFKKREPKFWKQGRVIKVPWSEDCGDLEFENTNISLGSKFGVNFIAKIRWFLVYSEARRGAHKCQCLPINTHSHRGMGKPGLVPEFHSIIYTGDFEPDLSEDEDPTGIKCRLMQRPIRVKTSQKRLKMHPKSRLNYRDLQSIDQRSRVFDFGVVHPDHMRRLRTAFSAVWAADFADHRAAQQATYDAEDAECADNDPEEESDAGMAAEEYTDASNDDCEEDE